MNTTTETARSRPSATVMNPPDFLIGCRPAVSNATPAFAAHPGCSRDPCGFGPVLSGSLLAKTVIGRQAESGERSGGAGHRRPRRGGGGPESAVGFVEILGPRPSRSVTGGVTRIPRPLSDYRGTESEEMDPL